MTEEKKDESNGGSEAEVEEQDVIQTKIRLVIPQRLDFMTFVGRDVVAVAHDVYIVFFNLKTKTELIYVANNVIDGDGVDCITGHRSNIFAFAEKPKNPRVFIVSYPAFTKLTEFKDMDVNRYKSLCLMESDLMMTFSGFPNYAAAVWNWRGGQRLLQVNTGVTWRQQVYMSSRSHTLVCECWREGILVWEVSPGYKRCLLMKRELRQHEGLLVDVCWTVDGQLYAINDKACLYSICSDGIGLVSCLEWSSDSPGDHKSHICSFGNGVIIYCNDGLLRSLKKLDKAWKVAWSWSPPDDVVRLISNVSADVAVVWTARGFVYKLSGDSEEKIKVKLFIYKQRNILKAQVLAPDSSHVAVIGKDAVLSLYHVATGRLLDQQHIRGNDVSMECSPVDPLIVIFGEIGPNYGLRLLKYQSAKFHQLGSMALTHQIVSRIVFSPDGRYVIAGAMSAGHVFIFNLSSSLSLSLIRYVELGRGLADCTMGTVGDYVRAFCLVLVSDKYAIGEKIICMNAETGKDNKFTGKLQGPYAQLVPLSGKDILLAIPHLTTQVQILMLSADKGVTVTVKIGMIIESGHDLRQLSAHISPGALLTYGYDGAVILRKPHGPEEYDLKLLTSHRYEQGIRQVAIDGNTTFIVSVANNGTLAVHYLDSNQKDIQDDVKHPELDQNLFSEDRQIAIMNEDDKTYLELQEEKKVKEEEEEYRLRREEVIRDFEVIRSRHLELLEENLSLPPEQQLPLEEFDLNTEAKKEKDRQAEREREEMRLETEALIQAQDKVTAYIKKNCWDVMLTPRVKILAIFSHYQVENYAVLPNQRDNWPELEQIAAIRAIEMEGDQNVFKPWIEKKEYFSPMLSTVPFAQKSATSVTTKSKTSLYSTPAEHIIPSDTSSQKLEEYQVLSGTDTHKYVEVPRYMVPQTMAYSYLQMNWLQHIVKLNVQNMRLWFNKQFDELMYLKKREMKLVEDRNARLRFILSELNKLSDLRGSFHHLNIQIVDPVWSQDEMPSMLIKVDPEECSVPPYVSSSERIVIPPELGPKDDFRERALMEMMDGVLEKLWHEEIKKPIPKPQFMLEKEPENYTEDDLRMLFDYEAKVAAREQERDKYRKMLHAEYAKLTDTLNEGVVKFNQKVKEMWLTKLKVDSVIGEENLNLMRLRRINLDRLEDAEKLEEMRAEISGYESEVESLSADLKQLQAESEMCQNQYEMLTQKDRLMEKNFKNHFADLSPIIVDQCFKFFKKRPKWQQRATMTPTVLYDLAAAVTTGVKPPLLHADCLDYFKGVESLDSISNMPAVMDEALWSQTCKLRRVKIDNEIRMRAVVQEQALLDSTIAVWNKAITARRNALQRLQADVVAHRERVEDAARNKTIQLVLPAGQVEIPTTGHIEDFDDALLVLRTDIDAINDLILKVGEQKIKMMEKQIEFRKGILTKEWEHAELKMKITHMEEELYAYERIKVPKELQEYLKNKELGRTEEQEFLRLEKEAEATKASISLRLNDLIQKCEDLEVRTSSIEAESQRVQEQIEGFNAQVSEKKLLEDPLQPIRIRRIYKKRLETLVTRARLVREVQSQHSRIVMLQTKLELLRLKTYPTLAAFRTTC